MKGGGGGYEGYLTPLDTVISAYCNDNFYMKGRVYGPFYILPVDKDHSFSYFMLLHFINSLPVVKRFQFPLPSPNHHSFLARY